MYIVGFNGPPQSGKDTMADMLADHMDMQGVKLPIIQVSLSEPLRRIAYAMTGTQGELVGPDYEAFKNTQFDEFGWKTGRQLMIDVSESFLKPVYGKAIMANLLIQKLVALNFHGIVLIRDTGFQVELDTLAQVYGASKIYAARIHRSGCSFDGDSREWVQADRDGDYENNGSLDDLRVSAGRLYSRLVNNCGWQL